jgi:hypothetical protein
VVVAYLVLVRRVLASSEMKAFAYVIAFVRITGVAFAEDALMDGGRSPNGNFEVRIAREATNDPSDYGIHIHSVATAKPFFTLDGIGGLLHYPGALERCHALWHPSSQFVAITDQGTRHSRELYLLAVYPDRAERLEFPNYVQNALGRVNATSVDFACISSPKRWDGDDLLVDFSFTTNQRRYYTSEVILHVSHGEHSAPSIQLKSVSKPSEKED